MQVQHAGKQAATSSKAQGLNNKEAAHMTRWPCIQKSRKVHISCLMHCTPQHQPSMHAVMPQHTEPQPLGLQYVL
jgi:hypothetical protein